MPSHRFNPGKLSGLRIVLRSTSAFAALVVTSSLYFAGPGYAQDPAAVQSQIVFPGSMAVSGFSGTIIPGIEDGLPPGIDPIDETFIDLDGATVRIFDSAALGAPPSGQLVNLPQPFEVTAGQIGQVFGLTYDDGVRDGVPSGVPNLYAAASSLHGVRIVTPDADADGRAERQKIGTAGSAFMDGQYAENNGGGPGAIWKIDGLTGAATLFANVDTNSGPGLGDVSFDKVHRQFFASDLDTGLIHRINSDGSLIDTFDHGVAGRPGHGLAPVNDDGAVMDIQGAAFDSEDPATWGYTQDERRVWAVAVNGGRLYYSVGNKAEIWSVGITREGNFAGDARWELTVASEAELPVTDIAFDNKGFLYLAQRGATENGYDYKSFAKSGTAEVLRYWRESPDDPATESIWVEAPQEYAVGFPEPYRQSAGGIDLQYGYDAQGNLNPNACAATIVKTGDRLRDNPALAAQLEPGGPLVVHGVQLASTTLVKPANAPPFGSWFVDYDGFYEDPEVTGHVGDVEVWRPCEGRAGYYEQLPYPGGFPVPYWPPDFPPPENYPPCIEVEAVDYFCTPAGDLEADIYLRDHAGIGGDSIKADSRTPGMSLSPSKQTRLPGEPFTLGMSGYYPGQTVDVGLCFYKQSDADKGGYYPCCKMVLPLETPAVSCEP